MGPMVIVVIVAVALFFVLLLWVISIYNRLVSKRVNCDNAWAQIDVQLKRRHDLIPNLVETVKGYAGHERNTLEAVIAARNQAVAATGKGPANAGAIGAAEGVLNQALGRLLAVAEAYPDLKANANFMGLQEELTSTENKIGFARQHYNDCVAGYGVDLKAFPSNIVAGAFNFKEREYFNITDAAERQVPKVSFS